jgi:hypothetical protein
MLKRALLLLAVDRDGPGHYSRAAGRSRPAGALTLDGPRSIGHQDPGATSSHLLLSAAAATLGSGT